MEPRIASLLGGNFQPAAHENFQPAAPGWSFDPSTVNFYLPQPVYSRGFPFAGALAAADSAPQHVVAPLSQGSLPSIHSNGYLSDRNGTVVPRLRRGSSQQKPAKSVARITEVLNDEQAEESTETSLEDIFPDANPRKKRKLDQSVGRRLPKPQPKAKKNDAVPQIPPVLQGLHQPPENAGIFPPIIGDASQKPRTSLAKTKSSEPPIPIPPLKPKPAPGRNLSKSGLAEPELQQPSVAPSKRKKWTDAETACLLQGVEKYGIGNWKKILCDPAYSFADRKAVDLKDRFRTCCPDQYKNLKKVAPDNTGENSVSDTTPKLPPTPPKPTTSLDDILNKDAAQECDSTSEKKDINGHKAAELERFGVKGIFARSKRRARTYWSKEDDEALLRGVDKWGHSWFRIRRDPSFPFQLRHPTDLRDRFRNAFPERFKSLGFAVPQKKERKEEQLVVAEVDAGESLAVTKPDTGSSVNVDPQKGRSSGGTKRKSISKEVIPFFPDPVSPQRETPSKSRASATGPNRESHAAASDKPHSTETGFGFQQSLAIPKPFKSTSSDLPQSLYPLLAPPDPFVTDDYTATYYEDTLFPSLGEPPSNHNLPSFSLAWHSLTMTSGEAAASAVGRNLRIAPLHLPPPADLFSGQILDTRSIWDDPATGRSLFDI